MDTTELENSIKRINEIIEFRNIMEELSRVTSIKIDVQDIFREISDINILMGVSRTNSIYITLNNYLAD